MPRTSYSYTGTYKLIPISPKRCYTSTNIRTDSLTFDPRLDRANNNQHADPTSFCYSASVPLVIPLQPYIPLPSLPLPLPEMLGIIQEEVPVLPSTSAVSLVNEGQFNNSFQTFLLLN